MSWSDVFPVLSDEMVEEYLEKALKRERKELAGLCAVRRVVNRRDVPHVVSVSLFSKAVNDGKKVRQSMKHLLRGALWVKTLRSDVAFRVYLAAELEHLVPELVKVGCEVRLMAASASGGMGEIWRFLALEEDRLVTVLETPQAGMPEADILRTEAILEAGLGFWRVPRATAGDSGYRPVIKRQMGCAKALPVRVMMEALIWQGRRGGIVPSPETSWPEAGFVEWFLLAAIFPRIAFEGVLTVLENQPSSALLALDMEYCGWANPSSEVLLHGDDGALPRDEGGTQATAVLPAASVSSDPLGGRRAEYLSRLGAGEEISERMAVLIFIPTAEDCAATRKMVALLVDSLIRTEFAGEILVWRERGAEVIAQGNAVAAGVRERKGKWSRISTEADRRAARLMKDADLTDYATVLHLSPGALACGNVEYLLEPVNAWRVPRGRTLQDTPILLAVHCPLPKKTANRRTETSGVFFRRPLERGAVDIATLESISAGESATLVWVEAGLVEEQLRGVWLEWLTRFAPEHAEILSPMLGREITAKATFQR